MRNDAKQQSHRIKYSHKKRNLQYHLEVKQITGVIFRRITRFFFCMWWRNDKFYLHLWHVNYCGIIIVCGGSILLDFVNTSGVCTVYLSLSVHSINEHDILVPELSFLPGECLIT